MGKCSVPGTRVRESPDRVVRNVFSAVPRQDEFPIFVRTEGQATEVVAITMDTTVGHLQRIVLDLWGIPTYRQRIVYPGTLRALQVHDALGHYNITTSLSPKLGLPPRPPHCTLLWAFERAVCLPRVLVLVCLGKQRRHIVRLPQGSTSDCTY